MALLLLLKLAISMLSSLTSLAALIFFRAVVLIIQMLRVPGVAIDAALDCIASLMKTTLECILELLKDGLASLISSGVELVSGVTTGSIRLTISEALEFVEKMKSALESLADIFPEVFDGVSEMVEKTTVDLWNNYRDALGYIIDIFA